MVITVKLTEIDHSHKHYNVSSANDSLQCTQSPSDLWINAVSAGTKILNNYVLLISYNVVHPMNCHDKAERVKEGYIS